MDTQSANSPFRPTGKRHRAELEPNETAARSTCRHRNPLKSHIVSESNDKACDPDVQANANAPEKSADAEDPDKSADAKDPDKSADAKHPDKSAGAKDPDKSADAKSPEK